MIHREEHEGLSISKYQLDESLMRDFSNSLRHEFEGLNGKEVYGRITPITGGEKVEEFLISLTTKNMQGLDSEFIRLAKMLNDTTSHLTVAEENFLKGYHPFFFEFFAEKCEYDDILLKESGKWKRMKLYFNSDGQKEGGDVVVHGDVIFSASPLQRRGATLIFSSNEDEVKYRADFSSLIDKASREGNRRVEEYYSQQLMPADDVCVEVWNVGQANAVSIWFDGVETFFDIGLPKVGEIPNGEENRARIHMRGAQPEAIVLSHWDLDHILGVVEIGTEVKEEKSYNVYTNCCWIAPDLSLIKEKSQGAERLCFFLLTRCVLWLVNHKDENDVPVLQRDDSIMTLWQGRGIKSNGGEKNNIGLIVKLDYIGSKSAIQSVLLTGDCAYEAMPQMLKERKYSVVLSPHHGSEKTVPSFNSNGPNSRAIISVGCNSYGHPRIEHIATLSENSFHIYYTAGCSGIDIFRGGNNNVHIKRFR